MINYKNLKQLFAGRDIEYIKSNIYMLILSSSGSISARLRHRLGLVLRYFTIRDKRFNDVSREKRRLSANVKIYPKLRRKK